VILLMVSRVWQKTAQTLTGAKSLFGETESVSYIQGVAGACVTLFSCSKVTSRYTLPLLKGLIATQSGPFFYAPAACVGRAFDISETSNADQPGLRIPSSTSRINRRAIESVRLKGTS